MAHEDLHEAAEKLTPAVVDMHRAILSLMEELEAVDWYQQRMAASSDEELRAILKHNHDEEQEHAVMLIEWLRRRDKGFDSKLRAILFREGPIHEEGSASPVLRPTASVGALGRTR